MTHLRVFSVQQYWSVLYDAEHQYHFLYIHNVNTTLYRNDPKFLDTQALANSADPDQTAPSSLIRVYTVCHSICTLCTIFSVKRPLYLNFREITAKFSGVRKFRIFTVIYCNLYSCKIENFYKEKNNFAQNIDCVDSLELPH